MPYPFLRQTTTDRWDAWRFVWWRNVKTQRKWVPMADLVYKIHVYVMATANSDPESLTGHSTGIAFNVCTYKLDYLINVAITRKLSKCRILVSLLSNIYYRPIWPYSLLLCQTIWKCINRNLNKLGLLLGFHTFWSLAVIMQKQSANDKKLETREDMGTPTSWELLPLYEFKHKVHVQGLIN